MQDLNIENVLEDLSRTEGITGAVVTVKIEPRVKKELKDERTSFEDYVRERSVPESSVNSIAVANEFSYLGEIDVEGDFAVRDGMRRRQIIEF